jgi:hypothetical protein
MERNGRTISRDSLTSATFGLRVSEVENYSTSRTLSTDEANLTARVHVDRFETDCGERDAERGAQQAHACLQPWFS